MVMATENEPTLEEQLDELAARKKRHTAEEDAIKAEEQRLIALLFQQGETEHLTTLFKANIQTNTSSRLSAEVLIARGVDPDIVAAATKTTVSKPFLRFYPRGA
jgi:hypothetical protein